MAKKIIVLVMFLNLLGGFVYYKNKQGSTPSFKDDFYLLQEASDKLKSSYVDEAKVDNKNLMKGALTGMLKNLDRYSTYYTPSQNKEQEEDLKGKFAGVGILFRIEEAGVFVRKVYEGSPAEKAGVHGGDYIVRANDVDLIGLDSRAVVGELKGEPGSELELSALRGEDQLSLVLERGYVSVPTIKMSKMLDDEIAYLYISQFGATTAREFKNQLKLLNDAGMKGLIIDLRFNGGGYLNSAVDICSVFLEYGSLVAYKEGRDADREDLLDQSDEARDDIPLVILVNEESASASEVTAACLRDYKRCILVGEKSYGKGSVQVISQLTNGGSIRFTIAKYFTPGGYVIHDKGLEPDVKVSLNTKQEKALRKQISNYETVESEDPKDDQFNKAYEALQSELASSRKVAPFFVELMNDDK
jgi:carboxyl-terminal processing protease